MFDAIKEEVGDFRLALDRDPDPADDVPVDDAEAVEEPANDWPAADRN